MTSSIFKKVSLFALFLIPAVPLVVANGMFFPYITGKAYLFRILVELALGAYLILAFREKAYRPKKSLLLIALTLFTGVVFIADIFSPNPTKALWSNFERMEGFVTIAHVFVFFLVVGSVFTKELWNKFFATSIGVSIFLSLYGLLQVLGELSSSYGARIDGTLGNAAYFAGYLMVHIFLLVYSLSFYYSDREKKSNILAIAIALANFSFTLYYLFHIAQPDFSAGTEGVIVAIISAIIGITSLVVGMGKQTKIKFGITTTLVVLAGLLEIIILYLTATRGAMLGLLGGILLSAIVILFIEKNNQVLRKLSWGALALVIFVVGSFMLARNTELVRSNPILQRFAVISWSETKTQARSYTWPMAFEAFKEKPILGWGQEGFNYVFQKNYNPKMVRHEPWFDRTHNVVLDWLVAGGFLGALLYLSLFLTALIVLFKSKEFQSHEKALFTGLLAAYLFQNLFIFDNLVSYILFASLLAFIHSQGLRGNILEKSPEVKTKEIPYIIITATIFLAYAINWNSYFQNRTLIQAMKAQPNGPEGNYVLFQKALAYDTFGNGEAREQLERTALTVIAAPSVSNDVKAKFEKLAIDEGMKQIEESPLEARSYLALSSYLVARGGHKDAIPYLEKALELSPRKQQILLELGVAYMNIENREKGIELVKKAYDLEPSYVEARVIYASVLIYVGREAEGVAILQSLAREGVVDERVVRALAARGKGALAIGLIDEAIKANPQNQTLYTMLASLYSYLNNKIKAIETLERLRSVHPELSSQVDKSIDEIKTGK